VVECILSLFTIDVFAATLYVQSLLKTNYNVTFNLSGILSVIRIINQSINQSFLTCPKQQHAATSRTTEGEQLKGETETGRPIAATK